VFVFVILSVPLLMKWHHPLLILSWNAAINPLFLPGRASLWLLLSVVCLLIAILNRAANSAEKFISVPSITRALIIFSAVVVLTGLLTGGFGSRLLGSSQMGGRRYYYLLGAIAGYFALTSRRIPIHRAGLCVAGFFLAGVTAVVANLAYLAGPSSYFLFLLFTPDYALDQAVASVALNPGVVRISGLSWVCPAVYSWLLARYGIRRLLDIRKPWRLLLFLLALFCGLFGGYRSVLVMFLLTFAIMFWLEGLHRTKHVLLLGGIGVVTGALLILFANKLPLSAQRTLSILPLNLNAMARQSAEVSSDWRLQMWQAALPEIPKYLFHGKGYRIDPREVETALAGAAGTMAFQDSWNGALTMGDYHNGPLSVIIPFGIYGALAFLWFLFVSLRFLHRALKFGNPQLRTINALLLATFAARAIFFFLVFGSVYSDMAIFAGLLGLSVSINGAEPVEEAVEEDPAIQLDPDISQGLTPSQSESYS
jgi:hypothetical protein